MDYLGVKTKLNDWIFGHIQRHLDDMGIAKGAVFLDGCTGTGAVATRAAEEGFQVIANDLMMFSYHIVRGKLCLPDNTVEEALQCLREMDDLPDSDPDAKGFFTEHYSVSADCGYFTDANARKIDVQRDYIAGVTDPALQSYLLYCLVEAVSRVSNTAGTHGAFLKAVKARAKQPLKIRAEPRVYEGNARVYCDSIKRLLRGADFRAAAHEDVFYLDPPYNTRQYAPNYHLYETLVRWDNPKVSGKTKMRDWADLRSDFSSKTEARKFLRQVLSRTRAKLVVMSYSSDGLPPLSDLEEAFVMALGGPEVEVQVRPYGRYKADKSREIPESVLREYLIIARRPETSLYDLF